MKGTTKRPKAELLLRTLNNGQATTPVPSFAEPVFDIEVNLDPERAPPRVKGKKGKV